MNIKNIGLNVLGLLLYQIAIFLVFTTGYTLLAFIFFVIIEIYLIIILLYNNNKVLAFISIINFLLPLHVIFFIINIFLNPKKKKKIKTKEYFLKFNKILLKFSPIIIVINIILLFLTFLEFTFYYSAFKLEVIGAYLFSFTSFIFYGEVGELLFYYITKPIVIICFLMIIVYYTYLISVLLYFIKRKQPFVAFKIFIFNFFTFCLYSIVYLKADEKLLINPENKENSFEEIKEHNITHRNFFIKKSLVISLFFIVILVFISSFNSGFFEDLSITKKIDDNSMVIYFLSDYHDINTGIYETLGEGLYTIEPVENKKYNMDLSLPTYGLFIIGPENNKKIYNLPVDKGVESFLGINTILDYQPVKVTRQDSYVEYKKEEKGFYKTTPEIILKALDKRHSYGDYYAYNIDSNEFMVISKDKDKYSIKTIINVGKSDAKKTFESFGYTKKELKDELYKKIDYNTYSTF